MDVNHDVILLFSGGLVAQIIKIPTIWIKTTFKYLIEVKIIKIHKYIGMQFLSVFPDITKITDSG